MPNGGTDGLFPPDGFHLVDTDSDEGYFLTAYTEEHSPSVHITVRNLITGQDVHVSVPHEDLAGIYMNHGKVLLVYAKDKGSSMFIITDCREGGNGRTLWSTSVNTSVFHGVVGGDSMGRRLQPVFNDHYIAFLNSLDNSGGSSILILRFDSTSPSDTSSTELFVSPLRLSPSTLISLKPDNSGQHLLVAQRFPHHKNLHRVVLIKALSGSSSCAFHFNVSPQFSLIPERDMEIFFSPDENSVIIWGSVRSAEYRVGGILGQVMVFAITGGGGAKVRYLRTPDNVTKPIREDAQTRYSPELGVIWYEGTAAGFESLNLDLELAGTGEIVNSYNLRSSIWTSTSTNHPSSRLEIGTRWVYSESIASNNDVTVEMMRIAEPPASAPENSYTDPTSKRSSWFLNSSTAPGSSAASVFGSGMHPADTTARVAQVDAEELVARLKEMERERARETKRKNREEVKKGWKDKLLSAWR